MIHQFHPHPHPFSSSPISTSTSPEAHSPSPRRSLKVSACAPDNSEILSFPKMPISLSSKTSTCTDSEFSSDYGLEASYHRGQAQSQSPTKSLSPTNARSPSLLSCIFQSQSQTQTQIQTDSTASGQADSSQPTSAATSRSSSTSQPLTPTSGHPAETPFRCKPILRRGTQTQYTSASTSASEDNCFGGSGLGLTLGALGTGSMDLGEKHTEVASTGEASNPPSAAPSRQCSLKFAVKPTCQSQSTQLSDTSLSSALRDAISASRGIGSGRTRIKRYPHLPIPDDDEQLSSTVHAHPNGNGQISGLESTVELDEEVEAESESDEGYQEDSESGFTSDEDNDEEGRDDDEDGEGDEEDEDESYFSLARARLHKNNGYGYAFANVEKWAQGQSRQPYSPGIRRRGSGTACLDPLDGTDSAILTSGARTPIYHYTSTTDDNAGRPTATNRSMSRKISIADLRSRSSDSRGIDRCSRHVSPPPSRAGDLFDSEDEDEEQEGVEEEGKKEAGPSSPPLAVASGSGVGRTGSRRKIRAPPAARSPSAAGLARRRNSHTQPQPLSQAQPLTAVNVLASAHVRIDMPARNPSRHTSRSGSIAGSASASASSVGKCIRGFTCTPLPGVSGKGVLDRMAEKEKDKAGDSNSNGSGTRPGSGVDLQRGWKSDDSAFFPSARRSGGGGGGGGGGLEVEEEMERGLAEMGRRGSAPTQS